MALSKRPLGSMIGEEVCILLGRDSVVEDRWRWDLVVVWRECSSSGSGDGTSIDEVLWLLGAWLPWSEIWAEGGWLGPLLGYCDVSIRDLA